MDVVSISFLFFDLDIKCKSTSALNILNSNSPTSHLFKNFCREDIDKIEISSYIRKILSKILLLLRLFISKYVCLKHFL